MRELVGSVGVDRLRVDELAARSGASKATIYRYWPDRESLIVAALRDRPRVTGPSEPAATCLRDGLVAWAWRLAEETVGDEGALTWGVLPLIRRSPRGAELAELLAPDHLPLRHVLDAHDVPGDVDSRARRGTDVAHALFFTQHFCSGHVIRRSDAVDVVDHAVLPVVTPDG